MFLVVHTIGLEIKAAAIDALQRQDPDLVLKAKGMAPLRLGELLVKRQLFSNDQLEVFHRVRELQQRCCPFS